MFDGTGPSELLDVPILIHEFEGSIDINGARVKDTKFETTSVDKDDPHLERVVTRTLEDAVGALPGDISCVQWNFALSMYDFIDTISVVLFFGLVSSAVFASIGAYARHCGAVKR